MGTFTMPHIDYLAEYFDRVRDKSLNYLDSLSISDIDRKVAHRPGEVPVANISSFIVGHMAQHMGAITYIRGSTARHGNNPYLK